MTAEKRDRVHCFQESLKIGQKGEDTFLEVYWPSIKIHEANDGDFIEINSGKKVELKTDQYDLERTPNFFFERWSNRDKRTPGSVWQAISHDCEVFCYMFIKNQRYFKFKDLLVLKSRLEDYISEKNLSEVFIRNKGWITSGYKIPREVLEDLYEEWCFAEEDQT